MLNSEEYSTLFTLVQYWRFNEPGLRTLFDLASSTKRRNETLTKEKDGSWDQFISHERNDEISATAIGSASCAGAIIVVLSRLLLAFKDDLDATNQEWTQSGPQIEGCSVGSIIDAAANNFGTMMSG
jgi:hypothetical protein